MMALDTSTVRDVFVGTGGDESYRLFDEWLVSVQAEVWDEAMDSINDRWYVTPNPYRKGVS